VSITVPDGTTYNDYIRQHPPMLDTGGYVERTGLAVVHRGEWFSGVGGGGPTQVVQVSVDYRPTIGADSPAEKAATEGKLTEMVMRGLGKRGYAVVRR
jgi:hypothetical protein